MQGKLRVNGPKGGAEPGRKSKSSSKGNPAGGMCGEIIPLRKEMLTWNESERRRRD